MTINVRGNVVAQAEAAGYHAYYADGVTAVEVGKVTEREAHGIARVMGWIVLHIFE